MADTTRPPPPVLARTGRSVAGVWEQAFARLGFVGKSTLALLGWLTPPARIRWWSLLRGIGVAYHCPGADPLRQHGATMGVTDLGHHRRPTMTRWNHPRALQWLAVLSAVVLSACGVLKPGTTDPPAFYTLNAVPPMAPQRSPESAPRTLPTLLIPPPRAAAGFDSPRIIFVRSTHQVEYFDHSEWVDTPARMLGPLLAEHLQATGAFGAVVLAPVGATGDLRLETEITQLQHNFQTTPSRVQFTLRAFLLEDRTRRVLAWRAFHAEAPAASDTPRDSVVAANQAVQTALTELAQFVAAQTQ